MVELALPKNSRIENGKVWTKVAADQQAPTREFKIYRWSPDDEGNPGSGAAGLDPDGGSG